ncbi:MAG TPA: cyclophilin-like fold protein, partial [Reyranella sp.]|nr:cyclophilin-like fold protein [Reyranella sp.]
MPRLLLPAVVMAMVLTSLACRAQQASPGKIAITVGDRVLTATVADSTTARDFVSLLPLTLTMKDLFKRE